MLSTKQSIRYGRHLSLSGIGAQGQESLLKARVLVVGAGGLGSPILTYLAAAGVGTIGVVDPDRVELSNLQRQVIHTESTIGQLKVESAAARIADINSDIYVIAMPYPITAENALELIRDFDVVIDGTDNFSTRYVVADACALSGVPCVWGSVLQFQGQVSVFDPPHGPCYRCLYPAAPPVDLAPSCATGGVFGALCSIIGSMQVAEAIKLITSTGRPLRGRLWTVDISTGTSTTLTFDRDGNCAVCGDAPTVTEVQQYVQPCAVGPDVEEITPEQLRLLLEEPQAVPVTLVDVREPHEWDIFHIDGARLIPLNTLSDVVSSIDPETQLVFYCKSGVRSRQAAARATEAGLRSRSLAGGVVRWSQDVHGRDLVY